MVKVIENNIVSTDHTSSKNINNSISNLLKPKLKNKSVLKKINALTLPLLASACGGGSNGGGGTLETSAPAAEGVSFVETTDNVFIATSDGDLTLNVSSTPQAVTVTSSAGDDTIITGSGDDVIRAGDGSDNVKGGEGDDTIVLVGTTTSGQYSASSITNSAGGVNLSSVITEEDLNNNTVSEVGEGEVIDGGSGNDSLVIYGTAYINRAVLKNLDEMWVNSEVILTGEQFAEFGAFKGDGSSIIRVRADYLDPVTSENDDNKGGNKGHGNNTDGQDDDNPGKGKGGPNFEDKDGIDEDENGGGRPNDDWDDTPIGGETTAEPTIVDISDIYMANIGVLSLEGLITLIADDMHDFAGITNINGDGSTKLILNGNDDTDVTTFDLSAVNLSGIAVLDLNGDFNLIVSEPNDYFGIGTIAVNNSSNITLSLDNTSNPNAHYDFSSSPLFAVDQVKTYGDTKITFDQLSDIDDTVFTPVTGKLYVAIHAPEGGETIITGAEMAAHFTSIDTLELKENVKIEISAENAMTDVGTLRIIGHGTIEIDRTGLTDEQIIEIISIHDVDLTINVIDQNGNDLYALLPTSIIEGTPENDVYVGENGESIYKFTSVNDTFGNDTVQNFEPTYDKIDISDTLINFNEITQTVNESGLLIETDQGSILIEGLTEILSVDYFILHDTAAPVLESFSLSNSANMDDGGFVQISLSAHDTDSDITTAIMIFYTPSGDTLDVAMTSLNGALIQFNDDIFDEEGIYSLSHITLTDSNLNIAEIPASEINTNTEVLVINSTATNESNIVRGDNDANALTGTDNDDIILPRGGDDTLSGGAGNDTYMYFDNEFGVDTINDFEFGDKIDFTATDLTEGNLKIYYQENSLEIHYGDNKITLENFDGVLTNTGTYNDPIYTVMGEEARLDANHVGDVRPPTINEIGVPEVINLDDDIRFYVEIDVSDDISGTQAIRLQYTAADGSNFWIAGISQSNFKVWQSLNEWFMPGTYELTYVYGYDYENNRFDYQAADLEALGISSSIEITNSNPDLVDPVVNSITLDNLVLDLSTDNKIFITLDATDDMSGIDNVTLYFRGPAGQTQSVIFTPENGMISELVINEHFGSGEYSLIQITARDNAGHHKVYNQTDITEAGLDTSFELINPNEDITAPNIETITTNDDYVYVTGVQDQFSITMTTDENQSGNHFSQLTFQNQNGIIKNIHPDETLIDNISFLDSINADLWEEGTYTLTSAYIYDAGFNIHHYSANDLLENGISFTFEIVAPLKIYGTVENDLLIGGDGYDHFIFGNDFGHDTIESFTLGEDYIDLSLSNILYADITQTINAEGLLLNVGDDSIQINGLTETLNTKYIVGDSKTAIKSISFSNETIDITNGGTVDITVEIEDPDFDVHYVQIVMIDPDGNYKYHTLHDDTNYTMTLEFNEWQHPGDYTIYMVNIYEPHQTWTRYNTEELNNLGINTSLTVINDTPDYDAPELTDLTISHSSIPVGIENVINFTAQASDATSEISDIKIWFRNPSETKTSYVQITPDHQYIGGTYLDDWSEVGTYSMLQIQVTDIAGNSTTYYKADLEEMGLPATFEVTDANTDLTAPELHGITINQPYFDAANIKSDPLYFSLDITDDNSGIEYVSVYLKETNNFDTTTANSWNSHVVQVSDQNLVAGIYQIDRVYVRDVADNYHWYNSDEISSLGIELSFRVLSDGPQPGTTVEGTSEIDTIVGTVDDEVFTLHHGEDTLEFAANWGHDTILDFIQGDDVLDFTGSGLTYAELDVYDTNYGMFIYDESTGSDILLQNFFGELTAGDAKFATTHATDGNDTVTATELVHLNTGLGDDMIEITHDQFNQIDGSEGYDTIIINTDALDGIADIIALNAFTERDALKNIEAIDITNDKHDEIALSINDVINMTDTDNSLVIEGNTGDTLNIAGEGWIASGTQNQNGNDYNLYQSGDATLLIDQEIAII
ncbi:hypothetical protein [Pseudemcibacter aquimaris]|uniref:hypothetical protein n=1 Tax=Pseudemcibacter aquimaris TaxID=2857064 RepID=UPI0020139990|nr:hypothetical protein [Pseudemcibacter aquimaris]MCC3859584.1 hypothetical protein [Pseudemcibacter aquimaris]WDU59980.1 hypothetical protein KW060_06885 [Pseudemcibacter aquimaris]